MLYRARLALKLALTDRPLLRDYARWFFEGRRAPAPTERTAPPNALSHAAIVKLLEDRGYHAPTYGDAWNDLRHWSVPETARHGGGSEMAGDSELGWTVYSIIRAVRPCAVVETGVATGVTSAHALAALADNGGGTLHSIDLPPTDMLRALTVGAAIPPKLKDRWRYHWGSAKRLLPPVLADAEGTKVFIHDSDHSYAHMSWEIRTAWESLRPGDVIVSDDVDFHSAFVDTAMALGTTPYLIAQAEKQGTTGLIFR